MNAIMSTNPSNWGDMVKTIEHQKKSLPFNSSDVPPITHVSMKERKARESEFNPVTMAFADKAKDQSFALSTFGRKTRLQGSVSKFNILAHDETIRGRDNQIYRKNFDTRSYHILSNLDSKEHQTVPLSADEEYLTQHRPKPHIHKPRGVFRDFNLISNEYKVNHNATISEQNRQTEAHILKKYWETHDYDPIRGKYFNSDKEFAFRETRNKLSLTHGQSKLSKLPPCVKKSEGQTYNILNNIVKDDSTFQSTNLMETRSINKFKKSMDSEMKICLSANEQLAVQDKRKINRVSYNRWQEETTRGYDIINSSIDSKTKSFKVLSPAVSKNQTAWERIIGDKSKASASSLSNNTTDLSKAFLGTSLGSSRNIAPLNISGTINSQPVEYSEPSVITPASQLIPIKPVSK